MPKKRAKMTVDELGEILNIAEGQCRCEKTGRKKQPLWSELGTFDTARFRAMAHAVLKALAESKP